MLSLYYLSPSSERCESDADADTGRHRQTQAEDRELEAEPREGEWALLSQMGRT